MQTLLWSLMFLFYVFEGGVTTFAYEVSTGEKPAISNVTIWLCEEPVGAGYIDLVTFEKTPGNYELMPGNGVKFEDFDDAQQVGIYVEMPGEWGLGSTKVSVKAGPSTEIVWLEGPECKPTSVNLKSLSAKSHIPMPNILHVLAIAYALVAVFFFVAMVMGMTSRNLPDVALAALVSIVWIGFVIVWAIFSRRKSER